MLTYAQSVALLKTLHLFKWASRCSGSCESCLLAGSTCREDCAAAMAEVVE